jgi:hypothetical protein
MKLAGFRSGVPDFPTADGRRDDNAAVQAWSRRRKSILSVLNRVTLMVVSFITPTAALSPTLANSKPWRCRWIGWLLQRLLRARGGSVCPARGDGGLVAGQDLPLMIERLQPFGWPAPSRMWRGRAAPHHYARGPPAKRGTRPFRLQRLSRRISLLAPELRSEGNHTIKAPTAGTAGARYSEPNYRPLLPKWP